MGRRFQVLSLVNSYVESLVVDGDQGGEDDQGNDNDEDGDTTCFHLLSRSACAPILTKRCEVAQLNLERSSATIQPCTTRERDTIIDLTFCLLPIAPADLFLCLSFLLVQFCFRSFLDLAHSRLVVNLVFFLHCRKLSPRSSACSTVMQVGF